MNHSKAIRATAQSAPRQISEGPRAPISEETLKSRLLAADKQLVDAEQQLDAIWSELFSPRPQADTGALPPSCITELAGSIAQRLMILAGDMAHIRARIE